MNRVVGNLNRVTRTGVSRCGSSRCIQSSARRPADTPKPTREEPIQFTSSDASQWKASQTFQNKRDRPPFEPHVISLSFTALLVYFCILREENDVDEALSRGLFDHLPELEEQQLRVTLEYQKMHGHDTSAVENRLVNIQKKKEEIERKRAASGVN